MKKYALIIIDMQPFFFRNETRKAAALILVFGTQIFRQLCHNKITRIGVFI